MQRQCTSIQMRVTLITNDDEVVNSQCGLSKLNKYAVKCNEVVIVHALAISIHVWGMFILKIHIHG